MAVAYRPGIQAKDAGKGYRRRKVSQKIRRRNAKGISQPRRHECRRVGTRC